MACAAAAGRHLLGELAVGDAGGQDEARELDWLDQLDERDVVVVRLRFVPVVRDDGFHLMDRLVPMMHQHVELTCRRSRKKKVSAVSGCGAGVTGTYLPSVT